METTVKLVGSVVKSGKSGILVKTVGFGRDGKEYPEEFVVHHSLSTPPATGSRVEVIATTSYDEEDKSIWLEASRITPTDAPDTNLAVCEGTAHGPFQFFERSNDKMSFGNGLVKTGDKRWQRGVAFGFLAHKLSKEFNAGAVVRLAGRLRKQSYDKGGFTRNVFEIILDQTHTKILKEAVAVNPFEFAGITATEPSTTKDDSLSDKLAAMLGF